MTEIAKNERVERVISYGIFGDVCGSSIESKFNNVFPSIQYLKKSGIKTDDSEMTLAVKECIFSKTMSSKDFMLSFKKNCKTPQCYSKKTLEMILRAETNFTDRNGQDTNGAIMRASPFLYLKDPQKRRIAMENNLAHTHWNYPALKCCLDYVDYLEILLEKGKVLFESPKDQDLKFRIFFCNSNLGNTKDDIPYQFTQNGFTFRNCDTFAYAYWFFINHEENTYEKGFEEILKRGGDTDTVAKLYCEMVGCVSNCFDKYL